jgi:pimeloyl-ACP methyl ester carboxylesterase
MHGLSVFLERCLDQLGIAERKLVVHDWGSLALIGAQRRPELVKKLVLINATTTRRSMALTMRQARGDRSPMPPEFVEMVWRHWDKGTSRAVLALYLPRTGYCNSSVDNPAEEGRVVPLSGLYFF